MQVRSMPSRPSDSNYQIAETINDIDLSPYRLRQNTIAHQVVLPALVQLPELLEYLLHLLLELLDLVGRAFTPCAQVVHVGQARAQSCDLVAKLFMLGLGCFLFFIRI